MKKSTASTTVKNAEICCGDLLNQYFQNFYLVCRFAPVKFVAKVQNFVNHRGIVNETKVFNYGIEWIFIMTRPLINKTVVFDNRNKFWHKILIPKRHYFNSC